MGPLKIRTNNICCIGGNRRGGLLSCIIALKCPEVRVNVVDNEKIIAEWNSDNPPFKDENLCQILKKCRHRNLFFTSNYATSIREADLIFVPIDVTIRTDAQEKDGVLDFRDLEEVGKLIAAHSESDKIVVEKSAVSARALERISVILESYSKSGVRYEVLSNPEFITQGPNLGDLLDPKYVLIGCRKNPNSKAAAQSLCELYEHWIPCEKIQVLKPWSVEIAALAGNSLLAQKTSSINALITICEETGTDIFKITEILDKDSRLQAEHTKPLLCFVGFQKDVAGLVLTCESLHLDEAASYWQAVLELNNYYKTRFIDKIKSILDPVQNREIAILGFAQEKNTSETEFSPAIEICKWLLVKNCNLKICDPVVTAAQISKDLELDFLADRSRVQIFSDVYLGMKATSAIIVCTDWDEFTALDYSRVFKFKENPVFIDLCRCLNPEVIKSLGMEYHTIGLPNPDISNFLKLTSYTPEPVSKIPSLKKS